MNKNTFVAILILILLGVGIVYILKDLFKDDNAEQTVEQTTQYEISSNEANISSIGTGEKENLTGSDDIEVQSKILSMEDKKISKNKYKISGKLSEGMDSIEVVWKGPYKQGEPYTLQSYDSGTLDFDYNASDKYGNLDQGENNYVFRLYKDGDVIEEKEYLLNVDKLESDNDMYYGNIVK